MRREGYSQEKVSQHERNVNAWYISFMASIGAWLIQLPDNWVWIWLLEKPRYLGALLLALTAPYVAGRYVQRGKNENDLPPEKQDEQ
jgi:hypothetical protein